VHRRPTVDKEIFKWVWWNQQQHRVSQRSLFWTRVHDVQQDEDWLWTALCQLVHWQLILKTRWKHFWLLDQTRAKRFDARDGVDQIGKYQTQKVIEYEFFEWVENNQIHKHGLFQTSRFSRADTSVGQFT